MVSSLKKELLVLGNEWSDQTQIKFSTFPSRKNSSQNKLV